MPHQEMTGMTELIHCCFVFVFDIISVFHSIPCTRVLRIWSVSRRVCLRKIVIDFPSRSICWSTDGKVMIVGIGGVPATSSKDGYYLLLKHHSSILLLILELMYRFVYCGERDYHGDN